MRELRIGLVLMAAVFGSGCVRAQTTDQRPVLVELFTSEGCSSCPPADALLTRLDGMRTGSGELIVGLSEHVTYWNQLGWSDPFSAEVWTARQEAYGRRFRLESVYTPQMVVNGEREVLGSDAGAVLRAVQEASRPGLKLEIVSARGTPEKIAVSYAIGTGEVPAGASVWACVAQDRASSEVVRGENGGRRLTHVSVARSLTRLGAARAGSGSAELADAAGSDPRTGEKAPAARHVVVFVQEHDSGRVLAIASRKLE